MNTLVHKKNNKGMLNQIYKHVQRMWSTFNMKEIEDYPNLYNMQGVLEGKIFNLNSLNTCFVFMGMYTTNN